MSYNTVAIIKNGVKQKLPVVMAAPKVDGPDYVEVVADGVKTLSTLLNELYALINTTKLSSASYVEIKSINGNSTIYNYQYMDTSQSIYCSMSLVTASGGEMNTVTIKSTGSTRKSAVGTTVTDESSSIFDSGTKIRMYYNRYSLDLTTRASNCVYDNSGSDLSATDAQGAIDELAKPTFTEASTRANIASGDSYVTILGKIKKWFTDIPNVFVAKTGDSSLSGMFAPTSDKGASLGSSGHSFYHNYLYRIFNCLSIDSSTDGSQRVTLPGRSGTMALTSDLAYSSHIQSNTVLKSENITSSDTITDNITITNDGILSIYYEEGSGSSPRFYMRVRNPNLAYFGWSAEFSQMPNLAGEPLYCFPVKTGDTFSYEIRPYNGRFVIKFINLY